MGKEEEEEEEMDWGNEDERRRGRGRARRAKRRTKACGGSPCRGIPRRRSHAPLASGPFRPSTTTTNPPSPTPTVNPWAVQPASQYILIHRQLPSPTKQPTTNPRNPKPSTNPNRSCEIYGKKRSRNSSPRRCREN